MMMPVNRRAVPFAPGWRLVLVVVLLGLAASALVARAAFLQVGDAQFLRGQGDARNQRIEPLAATRGLILDRNGQPLAVSTPVVSIWAEPAEAMKAQDRWKQVARAAGVDYQVLKDRILRSQDRDFVYIRRQLSPEEARKVRELGVPGFRELTEYRRYYPAGEVASHVVGFTSIDEAGQEGMELAYESVLGARKGSRKVIKDLKGRIVEDVEVIEDPRPGRDLFLSIDLRIQYLAYRALSASVAQHRAEGGSVVVMDVNTGEVLAMANQPGFNPNNRGGTAVSARRNRAVTDLFEPGSTMKTFTVAAGLESGKFRPRTLIETAPGKMRIGNKVISDHHDYGTIDVTTVLTKSSNIGSSKIALALAPDELVSVFTRAGFGRATGSEFPGESSGYLPRHESWRPIELATLSYGYGLSVTALQLAQAYATIASGGISRPATLLRRETQAEGRRVLDADLSRTIVDMLRTVSSDEGTAVRARVHGYAVAGKTGTVHKLVDGRYAPDQYVSLFAGLAPASRPRIVTVVVVDSPGTGGHFGGVVAAPVFSAVTSGALRTLNVSPDDVPSVALHAPVSSGVVR